MKTSAELIAYVKSKVGCGYVWGTRGQICTLELIEQCRIRTKDNKSSGFYDGNNGYTYAEKCKRWLGKQVFDCGGLLDFWLGQDKNAQMYYTESAEKGKITTMPDVPGMLVFMYSAKTGTMYHVGVFIGAGKVIEARGVAYGVVITDLSGRAWTHWGKCSQIDYTGEVQTVLQKGSKGEAVTAWQYCMMKAGISTSLGTAGPNGDGIDGDFGAKTAEATREVSLRFGLAAQDFVDDILWGLMAKHFAITPSGISQADMDAAKKEIVRLTGALSTVEIDRDKAVAKLAKASDAIQVLLDL